MISISASSSLVPYVSPRTSQEFLESEYSKSVDKFIKKIIFPSPQSSLSTIIHFGSGSSIYLEGSCLSSVFREKVTSPEIGSSQMSTDGMADLLYAELSKLQSAYISALRTKNQMQQLCIQLHGTTEDIPRIVYATAKIPNPISVPIWTNLLKVTNNQYKKACVVFYEANQELLKITSQLVKLSRLAEQFLSAYKQ